MEKWLFFIPVLKNSDVLKECVNQIMYKRNVDIIILLNGADDDVKELVYGTYSQYPQFMIWENKENVYVTSAWNQAIKFFKDHHEWDRLFILNSDLTLQVDFDKVCREVWEYNPDYVLTPKVLNDKTKMYDHIPIIPGIMTKVDNPAGIFITLNHKQAEIVYPIYEEVRVWFNDFIIYSLLKAAGYEIYTPSTLLAFHHDSTHVKSLNGILDIIEEDKVNFKTIVEPLLQERIKQLKTNN